MKKHNNSILKSYAEKESYTICNRNREFINFIIISNNHTNFIQYDKKAIVISLHKTKLLFTFKLFSSKINFSFTKNEKF